MPLKRSEKGMKFCMTDILIFLVVPIFVIIASIILQTLLRCPFKVAGIIFIILIAVALIFGGTAMLLALAWIYSILALVVAWLISRCFRPCNNDNEDDNNDSDDDDSDNNDSDNGGCCCNNRNNVINNTCPRCWRG